MRNLLAAILAIAMLLVTACPRPLLRSTVPEAAPLAVEASVFGVPPIKGTVDFGTAERAVQADMREIGTAATVALIEIETGYTLATTVTNSSGGFILTFANSFVPTPSKVFYLEAIKGLKAGTAIPNRVGADLARARTLIWFQGGLWQSVSAGTVALNSTSTALSIILSLRSLTPPASNRQIVPKDLMGIMQAVPGTATSPSPYTNPFPALMPDDFVRSAYLLVLQALAQERDPFQILALDLNDPLFNTLLNAPKALSVASLQPDNQFVGGAVNIVGAGFSNTPTDQVVEFTGVGGAAVAAAISTVSAGATRITVNVPAGAVTGPISVTLAGRKMIGPTFFLALKTGHEALDNAGNLYVANEAFGTVVTISPQGEVLTFVSGLDSPRNLVVRGGKLYITCAGSKKGVVVVDLATPAAAPSGFGTAGSINDPRGIAFDGTGRCFVTDGAASKLFRIDATASAPALVALSGASLSNPHGLAFGQDNKLYVANTGSHNVLSVDTSSGGATIFKEGFTFPWGVAFDSVGNLYISNNRGNSVYRWQASDDSLAPFANMPSPGGIVADRGGYLYAVDNTSNNIYRITPAGESAIYASGISSPTGIAKVGNTLYVLSSTNNSLMKVDLTTTALSTVARGFSNPMGLAYDDVRDVFYVSNVGNGTIAKVDRSTGTVATILTGTGTGYGGAAGIAYRAGRLYFRSNRRVLSYDVTNFAAASTAYESTMTSNMGVSKDTSGGVNSGSYFIASSNNRILKVQGDGQDWGSTGSANKVVVFKDAAGDPNLNSPRDLTVDGAGNVWVVNNGSDKITSYKPDGSIHLAPFTSGTTPLGINRDATTVWVANKTSQTIVGYNSAGGVVRSISISDHPRNIVTSGTKMYVACDEGVGKIDNYATAPSYSRIYGLGGYNDIEYGADGSIYVLNGAGRRIVPDLSTDVAWYSNYHSPQFFWQGGGDFWTTDSIRFTHTGMGNWGYRLIGATDWFVGPTHAGIDSNGNLFINATSICSADVVNRIKVAAPQEEWSYQVWNPITCWVPNTGAFSADTQGNFYISRYNGLDIAVVDAAGNYRWIGGRASNFTTYGAWVEPDGSKLYQTVQSHHRIETTAIGSGTRTVLPYGISAAEM